MGQRYEKSKKSVAENRAKSERISTESKILREEYAPLGLLELIEQILDDEAIEAIENVKTVGELESQRLESETRTNEVEKREIAGEIDKEIAKLDDGLRKLRGSDGIAFGARAIEQSKQEYQKQIEQFKALMDELDNHEHSESLGEIESSSVDVFTAEFDINDLQSIGEDAKNASIASFVFHSITSPHSEDVKKWNSYLDNISKDIKRLYSERYGQYITPGKLDIPLSKTLTYETEKLMLSRKGVPAGALGYNDGCKSHVAVDAGGGAYVLQTTIHENLHQLSSNGNARGIIEPGEGRWQNVQMNEAITELLTKRTLGEQYGPEYSLYRDNRDAMELIMLSMGEDTVNRAYFQNRPDLMRSEIDETLGPGTWGQLSEAFDDALDGNPHTRQSGEARRKEIVHRYQLAKIKSKG